MQAWAVDAWASVTVARETVVITHDSVALQHVESSWTGSNPCPLYWQMDPHPLHLLLAKNPANAGDIMR